MPTVADDVTVHLVQDVLLGNPPVCVQGNRVTHVVFPVLR